MSLSLKEKYIILVDGDFLKHSDAIILLEGDGINRVQKVTELFYAGWSHKIIFSGGITDLNYGSYPSAYVIPELLKNKIPADSIIIENESQNTREQAINVIKIAKDNNWNRLILVASHYHQYRAYLTFINVIIQTGYKIQLINAPANNLLWFKKLPWGVRFELLDAEFKKIDTYSSLGHIASIEQAIEYQKWKEQQL